MPTSAASRLTGRGRSEPDGADRPARSLVYTRIIPSLLSVLEDGDDTRVVDAAARALGRAVEEPFGAPVTELLRPLLRHDGLDVQIGASVALGLLGSHDATDDLLHLASCSEEGHAIVQAGFVPQKVSAAAALALGFVDDPASVASLIDLVERLPDSEADTKRCAILAMGLMRNPQSQTAIDYLMSKIHDRRLDPSIQSTIPTALGRSGRSDAVATLLRVLADKDTDRRVAQSVVIGLGQLATPGHTDVVDALLDAIESAKDAPTRHFAFMSLARIGARDDRPQENAEVHERLTKVLGQQLSKPRRSIDRPWAALATGVYVHGQPDRRALLADRLAAAYEDVKDPQVRGAFALALGLAGVKEAAGLLRSEFAERDDESLRGHTALALGLLAHRDADTELRAALTKKGASPTFRRSVALACDMLGDRAVPTALAASFREAGSLDGRTGMAEALGVLRNRQVVEPLEDAATDPDLDDLSRASACKALGRVAEKTRMPWHAALRIDSNYMAEEGLLDEILGVR